MRQLTRLALAGGACVLLSLAASAQPAQTVWSGIYSEAQAFRGEKVADTQCQGCHGAGLAGGDSGPKLVGDGFLAKWDGATVGDLNGFILEKMPNDSPGTLKPEDVTNVIAYILKINNMPSGKVDLPGAPEALTLIPIQAARP